METTRVMNRHSMSGVSRMRNAREDFDPTRSFVAFKNFPYNGKDIKEGDKFPPNGVSLSTRKMRQLYESRYLIMAPIGTEPVATATTSATGEFIPPEKPNFLGLSTDGLRAWLANRKVELRTGRIPRAELLDRCEVTWKEYVDGLAARHNSPEAGASVRGEAKVGATTPAGEDRPGRKGQSNVRNSADVRSAGNS